MVKDTWYSTVIREFSRARPGIIDEGPKCCGCLHFDPDQFTCTLLTSPIEDCWKINEYRFYVKSHEFIRKKEMEI